MNKIKNNINWNVLMPLISIIFFAGATYMNVVNNEKTILRMETTITIKLKEINDYCISTRKISVNNSKDIVLANKDIEVNKDDIKDCKIKDAKTDGAIEKLTQSINKLNIILAEIDTWRKIKDSRS